MSTPPSDELPAGPDAFEIGSPSSKALSSIKGDTVNGERARTARIGPLGLLHEMVSWVRREGQALDGAFDLAGVKSCA
jgi:hypothetical protein